MKGVQYPIDAVITWVDGEDPKHKAKRMRYGKESIFQAEDIAGDTRYTSIGEIAVQTYGFVRIVVLLLVLYLLLHAVLGMRIVALSALLVAAGTVLVTTLAIVGA